MYCPHQMLPVPQLTDILLHIDLTQQAVWWEWLWALTLQTVPADTIFLSTACIVMKISSSGTSNTAKQTTLNSMYCDEDFERQHFKYCVLSNTAVNSEHRHEDFKHRHFKYCKLSNTAVNTEHCCEDFQSWCVNTYYTPKLSTASTVLPLPAATDLGLSGLPFSSHSPPSS